jgi:hypothetical protein
MGSEFRFRIDPETLSRYEGARADMIRHLGRKPSPQETLEVLVFVYEAARREGRLPMVIQKYQNPLGVETH